MHGFWRHPALPVGIVLLVLGLGNAIASHSKLVEYERRASGPAPLERPMPDGFQRLTARTNATLLDRLHRRRSDYGTVDAKRDFYRVVHSGGRMIAVFGLLLIGVSFLQRWRERRLARVASRRRPAQPPALPAGS
jgi:hypothetical protein